jgi:lipopolysaccharide/colanic/teichoic acid biosynthesis glycosyltransferase
MLFNRIFAFLLLIILFPLILLFSVIIFFYDFKNPFYLSERVGKNLKKFNMIKFRTMIVDAEKSKIFSTKKDDNRITPIGNFLRKYKIDEIPQIFNVILGDMTFVGPRPNVSYEVNLYSEQEKKILNVKPGITDISSIIFSDEADILKNSNNPNEDYRSYIHPWKITLGLIYIREKNFFLDLTIIVLTFLNIFNKKIVCNIFSNYLYVKKYKDIVCKVALRKKNLRSYVFKDDYYNIQAKTKTNILFISPHNSVHSYKWIKYYDFLNIKWISFFPQKSSQFVDNKVGNIKYFVKNKYLESIFCSLFLNIYYLIKFNPERIHIHSINKYAFNSLFLFLFHRNITLTIWGSDYLQNKNKFISKLFFFYIFLLSKNITSDGIHVQKKLFKQFPFVKKKFSIINFGVNKFFYHRNYNSKLISPEIKRIIKFNKKKIIFSNRGYTEHYGFTDLVKFFKNKKSNKNKFTVILSGKSEKNYSDKNALIEKIKKYDLEKNFVLLDYLNQNEIKFILLNSSVYVSSSKTDAGLSSSIAEAMSMNIPIVAHNNSDNKFWIKNNINGFIYKTIPQLDKSINLVNNLDKKQIQLKNREFMKLNNYDNEMKSMMNILF